MERKQTPYMPSDQEFLKVYAPEPESTHAQLTSRNTQLKKAHDEMEQRVKERTEELARANQDLKAEVAERKKSETTLRQNEKDLTDFFENAPIGLHWVGPDGIILKANKSELESLGYKPEEYIGHHIKEFHADEPVTCGILDRLMKNEQIHNYEARLKCKDGSIKDVLISSNVLWKDGKFIHTRCFTRDITDIKKQDKALQESFEAILKGEEKFKQLANTMPQIVWTARPDGTLDYYNDRWYEFTGRPRGEQGDESWKPILHPDDVQPCMDCWYASVKSGEPYQIEYRFKDKKSGHYRWFLGRALPVRDKSGQILRWFGTSTDINEQKQTRERLALKYQITHLFVETNSAKDAVAALLKLICNHLGWQAAACWQADEDSQTLHCLDQWNTPDFKGEEFIKMTCEHKFHKGMGLPGQVWETGKPAWLSNYTQTGYPRASAAMKAGLNSAFAFPIKLKNKVIAIVEFFGSGHHGADQELITMMSAVGEQFGVFIDKKRIEKEMAKSKLNLERTIKELERSNTELEQFAYVASHDLQEPLRMVTAYTELLADRYGSALDDEAKTFIKFATEGALRSQQLINDLLEYSRVRIKEKIFGSIKLESVVKAAIENLVIVIEKNQAIITVGKLPEITGYQTKLIQLFQNLINNAIKFRTKEIPRIHVGAQKNEKDKWQFFVKDNGIGIDPQYHERVFVIFQRLHARSEYQGTGIGLAVCKKIVEQHHGRIWIESELGKGTAFHFTLSD